MKITSRTHFSNLTKEKFLPENLLAESALKKFNIWLGGISYLHKGSFVARPDNRAFHIMIIGISGVGRFEMEDGTKFLLTPGEIFFSAANGQGHIHLPETDDWKICWIQIAEDASWLVGTPKDYIVFVGHYNDQIEYCMNDMINESRMENDDYIYIQTLRFELLILYLKRELNTSQYSGRDIMHMKRFNSLWQEVSSRISEKWNLTELCNFMNVSRAHLIRLCKQYYRMSPTEKIRQIKMNYASSLLKTMGYTTSEVAEAIGYDSLSAFTTAFKKYFGFVPSSLN